jgi:hypothetical protein
MVNIQRRLDARNALGQSSSEAKTPLIELGTFEPKKLLQIRFAPRAESSQLKTRTGNITQVTVRLGTHKQFQSPLQGTFSVGKHPTAVSLNDRYLETFFCRRTPGNSLILLSTTAIDVVNRGSGVELSVRLSKILGTTKDKLLAGAWCEYSQRLILVGNHRMYFFDMQGHEHARKFRCEPTHGDPGNTPRFLGCTHDGSIFYGKIIDILKNLFVFSLIFKLIDLVQIRIRSRNMLIHLHYSRKMKILNTKILIIFFKQNKLQL